MAEPAKKLNDELDDDAAFASSGEDGQKGEFNPFHRSILVGNNTGFVINDRKIEINYITQAVRDREKLSIEGHNLMVYDKAVLVTSKTGSTYWQVVDFRPAQTVNDSITFLVPDLHKVLSKNDEIQVELFSSDLPSANGRIVTKIVYLGEREAEQQAETESESEKETSSPNEKKTENLSDKFNPISLVLDSAGVAIGGVVKPFLPKSVLLLNNRNNLEEAIRSGDKKAIKTAIEQAKKFKDSEGLKKVLKFTNDSNLIGQINQGISSISSDTDESKYIAKEATVENFRQTSVGSSIQLPSTINSEVEVSSKKVLPENSRQALDIVGEYISQNPTTTIPTNSVRGEVLGALKTGNLSSLNSVALDALSRVTQNVESNVSISGSNSAQIRQALKITGRLVSFVSGRIRQGSKAELDFSISNAQRVSSAIRPNGSSSGGKKRVGVDAAKKGEDKKEEDKVRAEEEDKEGFLSNSEQGSGGLKTGFRNNSKPSDNERKAMDKVGEEIYKNTSLIPNSKVREEVLNGLGRNDISKLSPAAHENLANALQQIRKTNNGEQKTDSASRSAEQVQDMLQNRGDESDSEDQGLTDKNKEDQQGPQEGDGGPQEGDGGPQEGANQDSPLNGRNLPKTSPDSQNKKPKIDSGNKASKPGNLDDKGKLKDPLEKPGAKEGFPKSAKLPEGTIVDQSRAEAEGEGSGRARNDQGQNIQQGDNQGGDEDAEQENQNLQPSLNLPNQPSQRPGGDSSLLDAEIEEAAVIVNEFVNDQLIYWATMAWTFSIVSFGLSILAGAILGDFLWLLKKRLIKFAINNIRLPLLKGDLFEKVGDKLADKITFSTGVKANIIVMNIVVIIILLLILVIVFVIIYSLCDYTLQGFVTQGTAWLSGNSELYNTACYAIKDVVKIK